MPSQVGAGGGTQKTQLPNQNETASETEEVTKGRSNTLKMDVGVTNGESAVGNSDAESTAKEKSIDSRSTFYVPHPDPYVEINEDGVELRYEDAVEELTSEAEKLESAEPQTKEGLKKHSFGWAALQTLKRVLYSVFAIRNNPENIKVSHFKPIPQAVIDAADDSMKEMIESYNMELNELKSMPNPETDGVVAKRNLTAMVQKLFEQADELAAEKSKALDNEAEQIQDKQERDTFKQAMAEMKSKVAFDPNRVQLNKPEKTSKSSKSDLPELPDMQYYKSSNGDADAVIKVPDRETPKQNESFVQELKSVTKDGKEKPPIPPKPIVQPKPDEDETSL